MTTAVTKPLPPHVVIVGGGLAGLAAAVGLAGRGVKITILESRPRLGGRASSFKDPVNGELVDNCQHVSMACCTNLGDFCRRVGIDKALRRERDLLFLGPDGRISRFQAGMAPAPFHLAGSFLIATFLGRSDKLRIAYAMAHLPNANGDRPGESFADWLARHHQTARSISLFWAPVLVSALNRAPRTDGCGACAQGHRRWLLAQSHGFSARNSHGPPGRALRDTAGRVATQP